MTSRRVRDEAHDADRSPEHGVTDGSHEPRGCEDADKGSDERGLDEVQVPLPPVDRQSEEVRKAEERQYQPDSLPRRKGLGDEGCAQHAEPRGEARLGQTDEQNPEAREQGAQRILTRAAAGSGGCQPPARRVPRDGRAMRRPASR